ncbi:type II toxin-antitoxin system PemK/MazF family toxin [Bifidobacterium catulorum]|uniref:Type II toxin-antitoxin system PemK/MazF family toxin n=1 Tax=Bifidobacterium catulorum TaxID=1630173 RepID=A0A2U2MRE2_9BIFI|nr:type II toxin-antitoxin system PemK/MazF family toxin [Bifidobacterium catulorum]PWG59427.1 hypothetical protein DF200_07760 [Bifidobacterium catulorum]
MTEIRPWQVWKVWFPYREDPTQGKYRRVIIKEVQSNDCVVIYVTSKIKKNWFPDFVLLKDWGDEGFECASAARCRRLLKIPKTALRDYQGELSPYDRLELQMRYQL